MRGASPFADKAAALRPLPRAPRPKAMYRLAILLALAFAASCSAPSAAPEPSLAPRAAEAIDPRVPILNEVPPGSADASLASQLAGFVNDARAGIPSFNATQAEAERLAADAGPMASESWVAAQQALSRLIEQYGVTTRAAANIDDLGSGRLQSQHWIVPADQQALAAAAAAVSAISDAQAAAIDRLKQQLAR